jgi:hypothetical protein
VLRLTSFHDEQPTVSGLWGGTLARGKFSLKDIPKQTLDMYDFVVPISAKPYFELCQEIEATAEYPKRVYFDIDK